MFAICSTMHTKSTAATFDKSDVLVECTRDWQTVRRLGGRPRASCRETTTRGPRNLLLDLEGDKTLGMPRQPLRSSWSCVPLAAIAEYVAEHGLYSRFRIQLDQATMAYSIHLEVATRERWAERWLLADILITFQDREYIE
jgi:hypothetical protein